MDPSFLLGCPNPQTKAVDSSSSLVAYHMVRCVSTTEWFPDPPYPGGGVILLLANLCDGGEGGAKMDSGRKMFPPGDAAHNSAWCGGTGKRPSTASPPGKPFSCLAWRSRRVSLPSQGWDSLHPCLVENHKRRGLPAVFRMKTTGSIWAGGSGGWGVCSIHHSQGSTLGAVQPPNVGMHTTPGEGGGL
ncbi:hypothetical protein GWK47_048577 [Chionoecetes opilio]|uniref:Uncharacterized protein n=1 Tax=Chionoecetes opilio TaxID=41210 RepID=A0A8J5CTS9_CHIOP|nr:hypothetical protein GWK47_048577 [Chionoecetes opilio]